MLLTRGGSAAALRLVPENADLPMVWSLLVLRTAQRLGSHPKHKQVMHSTVARRVDLDARQLTQDGLQLFAILKRVRLDTRDFIRKL